MASTIPGGQSLNPGVYSQDTTIPRGVSNNSTPRIAAIMGTGLTEFAVALNANGGGNDGLDSTWTTTANRNGRFFLLGGSGNVTYPFYAGTTTLYKNNVALSGIEITPLTATTTFASKYQYAFDPTLGKILLQTSTLKDQGGSFWTVSYINPTANKGGKITNLTLINSTAVSETWYIRCISVQRSNASTIIPGTAQFIAIGTVSGQKFDANGNPYIWTTLTSSSTPPATPPNNTVLQFNIVEGTTVFEPGDQFVIKVNSQILSAGDDLTATCVPQSFINQPKVYTNVNSIYKDRGTPSTTNTLSLGCQMAFENGASSVYAVQCAPPLPTRDNFVLTNSMDNILNPATGQSPPNVNDFLFPLPSTYTPDTSADVHFFITPPQGTEMQILPNKYPSSGASITFSNPPTSTQMLNFISATATGAYADAAFAYTLLNLPTATTDSSLDGVIAKKSGGTYYQATFSSPSIYFDSTYVGKWINVIDSANSANLNVQSTPQVGSFLIQNVVGGSVVIDLTNQTQPPYTGATFMFPAFAATDTGHKEAFSVLDANFNVISSGVPASPLSYTDGIIASTTGDAGTITSATGSSVIAAYITSAAGIANPPAYVKVNTTFNGNQGTYAITGNASGVLTIQKMFVNESNLRFSIVDPLSTNGSWYVLVNNLVVPNSNALRITIVSQNSANFFDVGWDNAFASMEKIECDVVVPLPKQTITTIFQNAVAHCSKMSSLRYRKERLPIIGAINGLAVENVVGSPAVPVAVENIGVLEGIQGNIANVLHVAEDLANYSVIDAYGSTYRCVYMYPDQIVKTMLNTGDATTIDGYFSAAALAGWLTGQLQIQVPPTAKTLVGFSIPDTRLLSPDELEQLTASGICTLQPAGASGGTIVFGITTSQSGYPEEQEISIVMIRDTISKLYRALFKPFIGQPAVPETQTDLQLVASQGLDSFVSKGWITQWAGLTATQDPVEPRQWNVTAAVQPTYGIDWIYINFKVGYLSSTTTT